MYPWPHLGIFAWIVAGGTVLAFAILPRALGDKWRSLHGRPAPRLNKPIYLVGQFGGTLAALEGIVALGICRGAPVVNPFATLLIKVVMTADLAIVATTLALAGQAWVAQANTAAASFAQRPRYRQFRMNMMYFFVGLVGLRVLAVIVAG